MLVQIDSEEYDKFQDAYNRTAKLLVEYVGADPDGSILELSRIKKENERLWKIIYNRPNRVKVLKEKLISAMQENRSLKHEVKRINKEKDLYLKKLLKFRKLRAKIQKHIGFSIERYP